MAGIQMELGSQNNINPRNYMGHLDTAARN